MLITANLMAVKYAGEIFNMNISVRNTALGGCGLTDSETFAPAYWNSSLLTQISTNKFELMHAEEYSGLLNFDTFSAVLGKNEKFSICITRIGIDNIPLTKIPEDTIEVSYENRPYKYKSINNSDIVAYFGFSRKLSNYIIGFTSKFVYKNLAEESGYGFGADISTIFNWNEKIFLALKLRDFFTTQIFWSTGTHEFVNPSFDAEIRRDFSFPIIKKNTKLFLRTEFYGENRDSKLSLNIFNVDFHLGTALQIYPNLEIFAGYNINNFTTGLSFDWNNWKINYSFEHNPELENSQRISIGYSL